MFSIKKIKSALVPALAGSSLAVAALPAHAVIDLTPVTGAVTAAEVTVGVLAIAAILAVIYATIMAAKTALRMLRGG